METMQVVLSETHPFTTAAKGVGYSAIAQKTGVTYQTVSKMANAPRAGRKATIRLSLANATLQIARERQLELQNEATALKGTIEQLEKWIQTEFSNVDKD